jgi:tetratricopeptide (TPR) repeat protein
MQQYRVNYVLLIVLFVVGVVGTGTAYGLWRFQMQRHADTLYDAAIEAEEEGDVRTVVQYLSSYVSFKPEDMEARVKLANAYADLTEMDDVGFEEMGKALRVLEESVRKMPEERELQKRLVTLYSRVGRTRDSLDHLGYMLGNDPDNGELLVLKSQYLMQERSDNEAIEIAYQVIGYDEQSDTFDAEKAKAADSVPTYAGLASLLHNRRNEKDLAERVVNQMVEANPDSAEAYLTRGRYFTTFDQKERGEEDINKAYGLDPEDADVLLAIAEVASNNEQDEKAREYLETGKSKYADDHRFYQSLALLDMKTQDYESALAQVDEGLAAIQGRKGQMLIVFKSDLQFRMSDLDGVRESIDKMREQGFRPQYIDWTEARILLAQGKWYEASEALSRLRADTVGLGDLSTQINFQLAFCYEQLGRNELARDTYNLVLQQASDNEPAAAGWKRVLAKLGQQANTVSATDAEQPWQRSVQEEMSKPKDQQNWASIDEKISQTIADQDVDEATQKIIWANLYLMRGDLDKSRVLLQEVHKLVPEENVQQRLLIQRLAIQLVLRDPQQGPEKALNLVDRAIAQFGDQPALRFDKADILISQRGEKLPQQLTALAEGIDDWTDEQKLVLWSGLSAKYLTVGMSDDAKECLKHVVELQPDNLPTRHMLFMLALETNDDVGMQEAQEKILEITKDKSDSLWQFTEARRMLSLYQRNRLGKDVLPEIRLLLEKAMDQRPEWHDLYLARAQLALAEGNQDAAMNDYAQAEQLGPVTPSARLQLIQLLVRHGQFKQASEQAQKFPEASRVRVMGQLYAEILFNSGDVDAALDAARELIANNPDNAANQLWFGKFVIRTVESGKVPPDKFPLLLSEASEAVERCAELAPESSDAWTALITIRALSKDEESANQTLRDAQLALSEDQLLTFLARGYEIMGRWFDAENMYTTAFEAGPDNYLLMQTMASFYLGRAYPLTDGPAKAAPLINRILRAGAEGELSPGNPSLQWARRTAARMLSDRRTYPDLIRAEKLLSSNAQQGSLPNEDRLAMARLLAVRPEPVSRLKAVKLLESLKEAGPLSSSDELALGRLYYGLNNWSKSRTQMLETIALYPDWTAPRKQYLRMLIQRGSPRELDEADSQIKRLGQLDQSDLEIIELAVRLQTKRGRTDRARRNLVAIMPKVDDPKEITEKQAVELELIAQLLVGLEDYDQAEKIYRLLVAYQSQRVLDLADFLGRYRDADQSFTLLQEIYRPERTSDVLRVALGTARLHRDTVEDKYDALMQQWLDRALREDPDSIKLLILQAETYDLQQRYEDAVATYQKLLANPNLKGTERAIALNNLSYMVALLGDKVQTDIDPLKLVQQAVQLLGPTAAILDTRAVVYTSQENYDRAIEDLELSLADEPSAVKYFHKVVAHLGASENQAALQAWDKAMELGLSVQELDRMERDRFESIKSKIDGLRPESTSLPESAPLSAAG